MGGETRSRGNPDLERWHHLLQLQAVPANDCAQAKCECWGCQQVHKRQRKKDQHVLLPFPGRKWCPQKPPTVDDQKKKKKKQTQITLIENPSRDYCVSQHILPQILAADQPSHSKQRWQPCALLAPGTRGSWMACSQCSFAAGGGSNWQTRTVQMGIKFSLMFIICQKRIILCQSGLETFTQELTEIPFWQDGSCFISTTYVSFIPWI